MTYWLISAGSAISGGGRPVAAAQVSHLASGCARMLSCGQDEDGLGGLPLGALGALVLVGVVEVGPGDGFVSSVVLGVDDVFNAL